MPTYKTPDVYVEEISMLPPSVAEVETAIPAFIGYTQKAAKGDTDLVLKPTPITSMRQFEQYFGDAGATGATVHVTEANGELTLTKIDDPKEYYPLYFAMQMFYDNGGGKCYVVSVGKRTPPGGGVAFVPGVDALTKGLNAVAAHDEPTLIVVPEATSLGGAEYGTLVKAVLEQCGRLKDRFGIFDLLDGGNAEPDFDAAREAFGTSNLKYGAVYYPFLRTALTFPYVETEALDAAGNVTDVKSNVLVSVDGGAAADVASLRSSNTARYNFVKNALREHRVILPPSGAVAGIYAATDNARGVWKAPANISLADVIAPVVAIDSAAQEDMNVDPETGKSINAIRAFTGKGTLVWGARTLAGNDNEWRYISVRRFFNMVEESVKKSTYWAVFEPNDANTWVKVRGMIESYLADKWREGALAGATPKEAFFVKCGLGITMTAQDILEGRMIVEIGLAVVRPAEFIILRFSHKLQTS